MGRNRSCLGRCKYFKAQFRKENYSSHNKWMNRSKWTEYCELDWRKEVVFKIGSSSSSKTTMHAFSRPRSLPLCALINKGIVNIII